MNKEKQIILDGVIYKLTPLDSNIAQELEPEGITFYYGCVSDCGYFEFSVLLNNDDKIWNDTQSLTFYPEGQSNKNESEYWDNSSFLKDVLKDNLDNEDEIKLRKDIGDHKYISLVNLLQKVNEKGWL